MIQSIDLNSGLTPIYERRYSESPPYGSNTPEYDLYTPPSSLPPPAPQSIAAPVVPEEIPDIILEGGEKFTSKTINNEQEENKLNLNYLLSKSSEKKEDKEEDTSDIKKL